MVIILPCHQVPVSYLLCPPRFYIGVSLISSIAIAINDFYRCHSLNFVHFAGNSMVYAEVSSLPALGDLINDKLVKIDLW